MPPHEQQLNVSDEDIADAPRSEIRREIDDDRVAVMLGLSREKIRLISEELGIGRKSAGGASETIVFTYAELHRLCRSAARAV